MVMHRLFLSVCLITFFSHNFSALNNGSILKLFHSNVIYVALFQSCSNNLFTSSNCPDLRNIWHKTVLFYVNIFFNNIIYFGRYRASNVKSMESSRKYSEDLPKFLHNRPRLFIDHCTKRLSSAMSIPVSNICSLPDKKFTVINEDKGISYMLDLSSSLPKCSCPDWKKSHLPCKHMLCILMKVPGSG